MKSAIRYIVLFVLTLSVIPMFGQATKKERNLIKKGNEYYQAEKYSEAENCYKKVLEVNPHSSIAKFNLATTLLRLRSADATPQDSVLEKRAEDLLASVTRDDAASSRLKEKAHYDLGRFAYEREDFQQSVDQFKQALRIDPKDEYARKNLRMAQKQLQNQNNQNKQDNKNDDKKDKKDKQGQDNQPQNNSPQNQPKQEPPKQKNVNSENILKAMQNEEKNTRDKVNKRKEELMQGRPRSNKPW